MSATAWIDLSLLMTEVKETVRLAVAAQVRPSWRERLWTCPPETRLGVDEVAEAFGKSPAAIRALIKRHGLPCRRRYNELVFVVADLRAWLAKRETIINPPPIVPLASRRRHSP